MESQLTSSTEAEESLYESESFDDRPLIYSITVPETVKRRLPTKHYVYKVVVKWTDEKETVIYRKYSFFFDFVVKLTQLVNTLSLEELKKTMQLPELPGRVLFGRSEVHQVAEKRRKKVEEFCQKLIDLPPEISQSSLVCGFFNTWPDDTMLRRPNVRNAHIITAPVILDSTPESPSPPHSLSTANSFSNSFQSLSCSMAEKKNNRSVSPTSPLPLTSPPPLTSPLPVTSPQLDAALEAIISHPDEMESLEQYRVLSNYDRKDAHQVSLLVNQLVHVIEKHDTGWWMVMSEDEQGYAPASYLEPVEESSSAQDVHPEDTTNQVYEAMESYYAENDDEITMKCGDRVDVISKSMDGWWKIRCNDSVGYSPAALIRRRNSMMAGEDEHIYESEKSIYEGLNIHRPPPRRNHAILNKVHRVNYNKPVSNKTSSKSIYVDSTEGESDEDTPKCYQVANSNGTRKLPKAGSSKGGVAGQAKPSPVDFPPPDDDHIYEAESPLYEEADTSIYENTDFPPSRESLTRKFSSPAVLDSLSKKNTKPAIVAAGSRTQSTSGVVRAKKPPLQTASFEDYEDPDAMLDDTENCDYVEMDSTSHNTYINPDDLRRGSTCSGSTTASSTGSGGNRERDSISSTPGNTAVSPKPNGASVSVEPVFDDDYITMDPLYAEPPEEDDTDTLKAERTPPKGSPKGSPVATRPLPPAPYRGESPNSEKMLTRAKSLEDLIASFSKPRSPDPKRKPTPPAPPRNKSPLGRHASASVAESTKTKPALPARVKPAPMMPPPLPGSSANGVAEQPMPNSHQKPPHGGIISASHPLTRSISPPNSITGPPPPRREKPSPHHPLEHAVSSPDLDAVLPKTYVSMSSYASQTEQCLSFSAGDKCVLIQQNKDGWWLVNIGGREGWTPGEYWMEDTKRELNLPKPPSFAPKKLQNQRKPRSHTVGTESFSASLEVCSLGEHSLEEEPLTQSVDVSALPKTKGPLPKVPPLPTGQKMKPLKPPKPVVPVKPEKPTNLTSRSSVSPPNARKRVPSNSPPPLPPANATKKMLNPENKSKSEEVNGHTPNSSPAAGDYNELAEVSTIDTAPWFAGKMERGQAEQFLMDHGRQREFLIRERSTKDGYYALSVRYHYSCKHFNIDPSSDGQYTMGTMSFPTIDHIIQHYQQNSLFIHDGQHVTLNQPVKKRQRPSDANKHLPSAHT